MGVVCKLCLGEKIRVSTPRGGFRYECGCLEWKEKLQVLEWARKKEKRKRGR